MTMTKRYQVLSEVHCDQVAYLPGEPIELDEAHATPLLEAGAIAPPEGACGHGLEEVQAAIGGLDRDDPGLWTKGGKPRTEALEAVLGRNVDSAERDAAWASWQARQEVQA